MIQSFAKHIKNDSLYRNSIYLLLTTLFMAGMGFVFWLINAHLFSSEQIGVATTLISAMTLVSYTSLLGFNSTFIRFLPTAKDRNNQINIGLVLSTLMALAIAVGYVILIPWIAPKLGIVHSSFWYGLGFVLVTALAALNLLTDSIFIAYRAAKYNLIINGFIMSSFKVLLPFAFISLGAYGIFLASGAAAVVAFFASIYFLHRKFKYKLSLSIDKTELRRVFHYSFSNYLANLLNIAPTLLLPIFIINSLGASSAAYYYLAFMMANLLYTVSYSLSQSLFAEGSYEDRSNRDLVKKASIVLSVVTFAGSAVLIIIAPLLLKLFGGNYAEEATSILRVLALSAPAVALYVVVNVLLRLKKYTVGTISVNAIYMLSVCGLALLWAPKGLPWIGLAWLLGNLLSGLVGAVYVARKA